MYTKTVNRLNRWIGHSLNVNSMFGRIAADSNAFIMSYFNFVVKLHYLFKINNHLFMECVKQCYSFSYKNRNLLNIGSMLFVCIYCAYIVL